MTNALIFNTSKVFLNLPIAIGSVKTTISFTNNLKHANNIDNTGVPIFDQMPFYQDALSCYVKIIDPNYNDVLTVQGGIHINEKIIGITNGGESISPNSVEILFYSIPFDVDISANTISPYIWENGQLETVIIHYPYFDRIEQINKNEFRSSITQGVIPKVYIQNQILDNNGSLVFMGDGEILTTT